MTKNITIAYNDADESFLMAFFKRMKIKTLTEKKVEADDDEYRPRTREEHLADLAESVREIIADIKGEIQLPDIREVLEEMKKEKKQHQTVKV